MKIKDIRSIQKEIGYDSIQRLIDNGNAWKMEGSTGRLAMSMLKSGACFLPKKAFYDYYGNKVPSRDELAEGTTGTIQNSIEYYNNRHERI